MQQPILFGTPIWKFSAPLPDGAKEWALEYKKANPSVVYSNRGGYQSSQNYNFNTFPYHEHVRNMLWQFTPFNEFAIEGWWLNVNEKGDYNLPHQHPGADLSLIWYITDNGGLLNFQEPHLMSRHGLYARGLLSGEDQNNKFVKCPAGSILIFPSDVIHRVEEHMLDTPRISVSSNLIAKYPVFVQ